MTKVHQELKIRPGAGNDDCHLYVVVLEFDSDVGKDVFNAAGRDAVSKDSGGLPDGTQRVMIDFEYMKSIVELVKRVDD